MLDSHRTIVRGAGSIILASVLFVSGATTPAWAEDASARAGKDIAASVDSVAPLLEPSRSVGSDQVAEVTFPADPTHGVTVRLPHNVGGGTTSIRLPKQMSDARPVPNTSAARAVYARPGGVRRAGLVIDNAPGITRIVAVVSSKSDAHHLSFGLEGFTPHVQEDGQALFVASDGVFIPVAAPWAKDARGRDLKTYFQTNGQDLVQVVSPSPDTVYPIVADPQMVWYAGGWGAKFSRSETSNMRDWSVAAGMCAGLLRWPGAAGVCGAWVSYAVFQATLAERDNPKTCLFAVVVPAIGSIWRVRC